MTAVSTYEHSATRANDVWTWEVDSQGLFRYCGPTSFPIIGYRPDELVGRPASEVMDVHELQRANRSLKTIDGLSNGWSGLVVMGRHRNGAAMWFEVAGTPLIDSTGVVAGFQGASRLLAVDVVKVAADQSTRRRVENMLTSQLLTIAFQPIVELTGGRVVGVEALSRFRSDPEVSPEIWFADAAAVGLGVSLELMAIRAALKAAEKLPSHLHISINASPATCLDRGLGDEISRSSLDPRRVVIELTEHSPVIDYGALDESLRDLRTHGVQIAVDDAGSGFASLQHILQLRPDVIKLDREVVANLDVDRGRRALGAAMVSFADHIGAQVIAEGIQTVAELEAAIELGMTAVQGYLLGFPTIDPREWARWDQTTSVLPDTIKRSASGPSRDPLRSGHEMPGRDQRSSSFLYVAPDVFDALPDPTVVVDGGGEITATNRAWREFGAEHGGRAELAGVGVNYLEICARAAKGGDPDAAIILDQLTAVLDGRESNAEWEYSVHSATADHRYLSRITSLGKSRGAIAAHFDLSFRHAPHSAA